MSEQQTIEVVEQKIVIFYDDELVAMRAEDGHVYVSVRHLCEAIGLGRRGQVRRIQRQAVLAKGHYMGDMMTPKGVRPANWLRVDLVPLWLSGVDASRVRDDIRPKIERFQEEAAKVLWEAFQEGRLTATPSLEEMLRSESPAAQAYKMAMAIAELARNQLLFESRVERRIDDHEQRLEHLEAKIDQPTRTISSGQASQISQAVKAIAMELSKRSGRNEYGGVYGELYRRFEITSYKLLPASRFDEAMEFLNEWFGSLTGKTPF